MLGGFGRAQKNIIFNRFGHVSEWHNCLVLNQMAGYLINKRIQRSQSRKNKKGVIKWHLRKTM